MGCPLEFSLAQISRHVRSMIEKAGFPEIAGQVDQEEISQRVEEIRVTVNHVRETALTEAS